MTRTWSGDPQTHAAPVAWPRWAAALALLHVVLALPSRLDEITVAAFFRLPIELPLVVLILVLAPTGARKVVSAVATAILTPVLVVKLADIAVFAAFARPFNPVVDSLMAPIAIDTMARTSGPWVAATAVTTAALAVAAIAGALLWAVGTVQRIGRRPPVAGCAASLLLVGAATPLGTARQTEAVRQHVRALDDGVRAAATFRADVAALALDHIPPAQALSALAGHDVLLIFVESYGRAAIDNPDYAPLLRERLSAIDDALKKGGFAARSAWLTSPTFGGESYLAHSSFISGLWVDDRQRYAHLLRSRSRTLIHDFREAGWRTVAVMPLITGPWPEGDFYGYDAIYDATALGYAGQSFGYVTMPDQYTLAVLQRKELAPADRKPVMAEIALIASHIPWTPLPIFVPWDEIGDGTVFNTARTQESSDTIWRDPKRLRHYYAKSVDYVLETLMSFITTFGRDDMLLIIVGDHQPMAFMADSTAREVPIHVIARSQALVDAVSGDWTSGMQPDQSSPILPMNAMRERILRAFTPGADRQEPRIVIDR